VSQIATAGCTARGALVHLHLVIQPTTACPVQGNHRCKNLAVRVRRAVGKCGGSKQLGPTAVALWECYRPENTAHGWSGGARPVRVRCRCERLPRRRRAGCQCRADRIGRLATVDGCKGNFAALEARLAAGLPLGILVRSRGTWGTRRCLRACVRLRFPDCAGRATASLRLERPPSAAYITRTCCGSVVAAGAKERALTGRWGCAARRTGRRSSTLVASVTGHAAGKPGGGLEFPRWAWGAGSLAGQ
jgi:hypothetical protein